MPIDIPLFLSEYPAERHLPARIGFSIKRETVWLVEEKFNRAFPRAGRALSRRVASTTIRTSLCIFSV